MRNRFEVPEMANSYTSTMSRSSSLFSLATSQDPREAAEDDFKTLIVNISENLENHDLQKIHYCYKRNLGARRHKLNSLETLERLENIGIFSYQFVLPLNELLRRIHRCDLLTLVQSYSEDHSSIINRSTGQGESLAIFVLQLLAKYRSIGK